MKKRVIKLIVCIMLISALMIGFCTAYASAATPVWLLRAKAGIAAALMAANIVFEPYQAALSQSAESVIDPLNIVDTIYDTSWDSYIDQSVITVRPDVVTIDGVPYSEIWLGPDAANSLRASGFDFKTAYHLLANQDTPVSYADGVGTIYDLPVYSVNGANRTQTGHFPAVPGSYSFGSAVVRVNQSGSASHPRYSYSFYTPSGSYKGSQTLSTSFSGFIGNPTGNRYQGIEDNSYLDWPISYTEWFSDSLNSDFIPGAFDFAYTSGDIDTEPVEDGLMLRVPSSYDDGTQGSYNYDIHDLINIYPQVNDPQGHELIFDPSLNPDFDTDIDLGNALGDIISAVILAKLLDLLGDDAEVIYAPFPEKEDPEPQPGVIDPLPDPDPAPEDPVPGTTIADTDWTKLDEILRWIQSTIDSIRHLTESLQTMLDSIFDAIQSVIQHIAEIPDAIRELADKILEDIELGPSKLFDKALDILKTLFLPLLLPIRAMMNLWHYVVEWVQSISSPFTWIFGIMSATSANMVLPIYALLAGGICISIYKALGR